jgi:DNA-binding response OmpR family regulator
MKLLIVEDSIDLSRSIDTYLRREGYISEIAMDFREALDKLLGFTYDVVLLDIMIPKGDGLRLLEELKVINKQTGVIIISAKDALDDKVKGLELGADDYLTKPFHLSELHARIKAVYRRKHLDGDDKLYLNEITIHTERMEVSVSGENVVLTKKEFELLLYFATNRNHVLSKQSIAEHLWGDHVDHLDNIDFVYQHIKNLRKKLIKAGAEDYIETVYGVGYRFAITLNTSSSN